MAQRKEKGRVIFEANLGASLKPTQWEALKSQMREAGLPITPQNLMFVAKCKRVGRKFPINKEAISNTVEIAGRLGETAIGKDIKSIAFELKPNLTEDKLYRAFRVYGRKFSLYSEYNTRELGEVFYMIFAATNKRKKNVQHRPS